MGARTLLQVVAHPDDDAYGVAGTVALHAADPGFRFVLVHATDGGAGDIRDGFPATRETLGSIRRAEDAAAWRAHGRPPDRHEWLGLDDGEVSRVPEEELAGRIGEILAEEKPAVVATFGPDGLTGHPDHIAVGAATDAAFRQGAAAGLPGFQRLVHAALPQTVFERWNHRRAARGLAVWDPTAVYHLRGVPDEEVGVTVDTTAVSARVLAGLLEHRSQLHVIAEDPADLVRWERTLRREHHVIAWPPRPPGGPRLPDLFAGLEQPEEAVAHHDTAAPSGRSSLAT